MTTLQQQRHCCETDEEHYLLEIIRDLGETDRTLLWRIAERLWRAARERPGCQPLPSG